MTDRARTFDDLIKEATTYYVRLQGAPNSRRYRRALLNWIAQSDDHAKAMDWVCRLWIASKSAAPPLAIRTPRQSLSPRRSFGFNLASGFAAVAAAICAVVSTNNSHQLYDNPTYTTQKVSTADGTTIFIGPHTSMAMDTSLLSRKIYLQHGIADFNFGHSFRKSDTYVRSLQIKDIGTHFVVVNDPDQASVTLISGEVAILDPLTGKEFSRLKPGNRFAWATPQDRRTVMLRDTYQSIAWENQVIEFDETPLPEAIERLHNFTGLKVSLSGGALSQVKISGTFNYSNPTTFFNALSTIYGVHVTRLTPGEYVIKM